MRYNYIIDQQPIGRLLFLQFCEEERQEFHRYNVFLDSIVCVQVKFDFFSARKCVIKLLFIIINRKNMK